MPQQVVFPCPSCGASVSAEQGARMTQCQFCGSTVAVPGATAGAAPQPGASYPPSGPAFAPPQSGPAYVSPPPSMPYYAPIYNPVYTNSNRVWRSVIGLNIFITGAVVVLTLCITAAAVLPFGLMAFPGFWTWIAHFLVR